MEQHQDQGQFCKKALVLLVFQDFTSSKILRTGSGTNRVEWKFPLIERPLLDSKKISHMMLKTRVGHSFCAIHRRQILKRMASKTKSATVQRLFPIQGLDEDCHAQSSFLSLEGGCIIKAFLRPGFTAISLYSLNTEFGFLNLLMRNDSPFSLSTLLMAPAT